MSLGLVASCPTPMLVLASGDVASVCFVFVVLPAISGIICWLLADAFQRIPERYRFLDPNLVWLLMVPLFNLYWNFKVLPALAESFQACFYSHGVADVEDCGERLARWYCYLALTCLIPCVNFLTAPAALVVLILFLVEADKLKKRAVTMQHV